MVNETILHRLLWSILYKVFKYLLRLDSNSFFENIFQWYTRTYMRFVSLQCYLTRSFMKNGSRKYFSRRISMCKKYLHFNVIFFYNFKLNTAHNWVVRENLRTQCQDTPFSIRLPFPLSDGIQEALAILYIGTWTN